jgi:hypothetical protein
MHGLFSHVAAALLAMHTVLGCCWHHSHACAQECKTLAIESASAHAGHDAEHEPATDSQPCHNHGRSACKGSKCVFARTAENASSDVLKANLISHVFLAVDNTLPQTLAVQRPLFADDALLPSLRLHLMHQVLLL